MPMPSFSFDPYHRQQRLLWQNRIARWRAAAGETVFHALGLCALAAVVLWPLPALIEQADPWGAVGAALSRWPLAIGPALLLTMFWRQRHVLAVFERKRDGDWLGLQPVPDSVHRHRRRARQHREAALQAFLGACLVIASGASWWWLGFLLAGAVAMVVLAPRLHVGRDTQATWNIRQRSAVADAGTGRLWRWQKVEAGFAFRGRSLAGGALILLLIPIGSGVLAIAACFAAGLVAAALSNAWRRCLGVLPAAQAWLSPQPLRGARLLVATCVLPALLLAVAVSMIVIVCAGLGAARFGVLAGAALAAVGILQFACVAAERTRPRRSGMVFVLHLTVLIGVLQALPMAAPLLWVAQTGLLLRRAVRSR